MIWRQMIDPAAPKDGSPVFLLLNDMTVRRGHFAPGGRNRDDWPDWVIESQDTRVGATNASPPLLSVVHPKGWMTEQEWTSAVEQAQP